MTKKHIGIIGGGISGLTAAYELVKEGFHVTVFEKDERGAGFADTLEVGGRRIEKYYHHFFKSDKHLLELLTELGLEGKVRWLPSSMGYFTEGRVYDFGTPVSLLKFKPLSFWGKMGFGFSTLRLLLKKDWWSLEAIPAEEWLVKNAGQEAYDKIWRPLLSSKFGARAKDVSMAWFWGKIKLRGSSKENGKEVLGYLDGSLQLLTNGLMEAVAKRGGEILLGKEIRQVRKMDGEKWSISSEGEEFLFDGVLSAIPQPLLAELLEPKLAEGLEIVDHTAVVCGLLEMDRPLTKKYWLNIGDRDLPFGGLIEHTNYLPKEEYGGANLLYISSYMLEDDRRFNMSEEELLKLYYEGLKKVDPEFSEAQVRKAHIFRSRFAQPIITLNYSKMKPEHRVRKENAGLYQTSMALIYPEDRGVNYAIRDARVAARLVLKELG